MTGEATTPTVALRTADVVFVLALLGAATAAYYVAGLRFDASTFPGYMQFIDEHLLQDKMLESIWYYHANPPLLNLFVGTGRMVCGPYAAQCFSVAFHALGCALAFAVLTLTLWLTRSRVAAYVCTAVLVWSPAFELYQSWLMYTFPAAALLTAGAAALHRYVATGRNLWGATFFGLLATLTLTRSVFHIAWLFLIAGILWWVLEGRRRQLLKVAALPLLVVTLWYGKNYYYFGTFSASTTVGLGLSNISTLTVPRDVLRGLVERGFLSPFAVISRYDDTDLLFSSQRLAPTGIEVLDSVRKTTGEYNYNNLQMLAVNRYYTHDALVVIELFPANYAAAWLISNRLFFSPTSMNEYFADANRDAARPFEKVFNPFFYGAHVTPRYLIQPHFGFDRPPSLEVNTGLLLVVVWFAVLAVAAVKVVKGLRRGL